jgi:hypothetical protein
MAVKAPAIAACLAGLIASPAFAAGELDECREFGMKEFANTPGFKSLQLNDNGLLFVDKFEASVGSQFVSSVIHGEGRLVLDSGSSAIRFICLHAGMGKGPVFFYLLPAS